MKRLVVGMLAHVDAGKTTLSEGLLYTAGALRRLGRVDHGDAFLDTNGLERERGITIFSKQALLQVADTCLTLLDTPGHVDFSSEMELNDSTTYYTSGTAQSKGSWIGVDLCSAVPVEEIFILQGRNSTDDVDYFDHAALQYSADGKTWHTLIDDMQKQYVIKWEGEPVQARFVRLLRLDSPKQNWASVRTFEVNPAKPGNLGFQIQAADPQAAVDAFDKDVQSFYRCEGTLSFGLAEGSRSLTLLTGDGSGFTVKQFDKDGNEILSSTRSGAFTSVELAPETAGVAIDGTADIYEIIFNK